MNSEPTWIVSLYWTQREVQTVYVIAPNESQAKMNAIRDNCKSINELCNHNKTTAVRMDAI